jgi:hypothetical protein
MQPLRIPARYFLARVGVGQLSKYMSLSTHKSSRLRCLYAKPTDQGRHEKHLKKNLPEEPSFHFPAASRQSHPTKTWRHSRKFLPGAAPICTGHSRIKWELGLRRPSFLDT